MKNPNAFNDRLFLQEIITDLERNGYQRRGKAETMLKDWMKELKQKTPEIRKIKRVHAEVVGKQNW